jgi:hypothetical protein
MKWYLFLDDIRTVDQVGVSYPIEDLLIIARNMDDAIFFVRRYGIPQVIHFDHDLAEEHYVKGQGDKTGFDFAKWICDHILDNNLDFPTDFCYTVHSMNPVGKEKIIGYMNSFMKHLKEERRK